MAILCPYTEWHPLPNKSTTLLTPRIINVHTMVWDLLNCQNYFAQAGKPYSHFGTGWDGDSWVARQWQELDYRAASDLNGNPFCISIENADKGFGFPAWTGSNVPRFHPEQAEVLAHIIAWCCVRFNIPPALVPDSLPGRVGCGKHRDGIDPWRVTGGVLYSSAFAKACPGDRRIDQLRDEIMPRVRAIILSWQPPPTPTGRNTEMVDLCTHPDGLRNDLVYIGEDRVPRHHWRMTIEEPWSPAENLGGQLKSVTCAWSGDNFIVSGQGMNDMPWERWWTPGNGWGAWTQTPVGAKMLPPSDNT